METTVRRREGAAVGRLEHVHLGVADVGRSADFYRRAFGFAVRYDGVGMTGRCVHVGTDRFYVALSPGGAGPGSFYHLAFTTDDLRAFEERLAREGIPVEERADRAEGKAVYVCDPDGYEIEVVEYAPGHPNA